jgi:hypothetical protein
MWNKNRLLWINDGLNQTLVAVVCRDRGHVSHSSARLGMVMSGHIMHPCARIPTR